MRTGLATESKQALPVSRNELARDPYALPKKLKDSAIRHKACDLNDVRGVLIPTAFHRREFPRTGLILADLFDARIPIDSRGERPGQAETAFVAPVVRFLVLVTRALPLKGIFLKLGRDLVKVPQVPTASPPR